MPCQRPLWGHVKHLNLTFKAINGDRIKRCSVNSVKQQKETFCDCLCCLNIFSVVAGKCLPWVYGGENQNVTSVRDISTISILNVFFLPCCHLHTCIYTVTYCMENGVLTLWNWTSSLLRIYYSCTQSSTRAIFISFCRNKLSRVKQNNEIMSYIYSHTCTLGIWIKSK